MRKQQIAKESGFLVDALEGRYGLALVFVECRVDDLAVFDLDIWLGWVVLERQSVLHPVLIVTLGQTLSPIEIEGENRNNAPQGNPHERVRHEIPCEHGQQRSFELHTVANYGAREFR